MKKKYNYMLKFKSYLCPFVFQALIRLPKLEQL